MKRLFLLFGLAIISSMVFADNSLNVNVQLDFVGVVEKAIPKWIEMSTNMALQIFAILWCFETFTQLVFKNVLGQDMKQLPIYFLTRVCFGGFFTYLLLKPDFYLGIIKYFGAKTTGIDFSDYTMTGFDAGWVFKQFKEWTLQVYFPLQDSLGIKQLGQSLTYSILYIVYLICTCAIALMIIVLEIQIYLTVFGALVLTGFAGSSWTYGIWTRYLDTVIGLGIRVMVFGMLYGLLNKLITISPEVVGSLNIINSTISIMLTTACLWIIPSRIASMVSGSAAGNALAEAIGLALGTMALGGRMLTNNIPSSPKPEPAPDPKPERIPEPDMPTKPVPRMPPEPKDEDKTGTTAPVKRMPPGWRDE